MKKKYSSRIKTINNKTTNKTTNKSKNKSRKNVNIILGCHASITPSVLDAIKYVKNISGNAVQIFLGSNRSASIKTKTKLTPEEISEIKTYITTHKITIIIHSIYLLNFCNAPPSSGRIKYMHDNIQYDLHLGAQIGAKCIVLHLGFTKDMEPTIAIKNLIANINKIIHDMPENIQLVLETSAGQGTQIGYTLEELSTIWNSIKHNNKLNKQRIGICIDTAHIFVSGYDISKISGIKNYLHKFNQLIGWQNIINFHINDSRYACGTRKDEHRGIGSGLIYNTYEGIQSLKYLKIFCQTLKIPMILETHGAGTNIIHGSHKGEQGYKWEIQFIQNL
jgi:deoxyribonuclease IV